MNDGNKNSRVESAHIEQSQQSLTEELSLKNIAQIVLQNWALFALMFVVFASASVFLYSFKIPYQSSASVIISDNKNSSLQSFTAQFAGSVNTSKTNEAKKANSSVQKSIEYLKTTQFYLKLAKSMDENNSVSEMTVDEKQGFDLFKLSILNNKKISEMTSDEQMLVVKRMDNMLKLSLQSDYEVEVVSSSLDKNLAYFVSKNSLPFVVAELKAREMDELKKVKDFLVAQKNTLDSSIQNLNKQLSDFQSRPENLISFDSGKVGDYISELMMRKNEIRMKISENNKVISALNSSGQPKRDSALYGNSGKIQSLKIENEMLVAKLNDLQNAVDRVTQQAKNIPAATITYDQLKKKSAIEFENYKQVSESLSKVDASELSLNNKFEILEEPRYDKVKPFIGLVTLLFLSLLMTQGLGCIIIYLRTIWDTTYVTAQQTRNIVVIDGHSLDPRVIIENSKIKFRLNHAAFEAAADESSREKRLGFSFRSAKTVNGTSLKSDDQ